MSLKHYLNSITLTLICLTAQTSYAPLPQPQLTPEQEAQMMQEFDQMYKSLSPAERKEFDEMVQALEKMKPEELEEFVKQVEAEMESLIKQAEDEGMIQPQTTPFVTPIQQQPSETVIRKTETATKVAEQLLLSIIARIDSFLLKVQTIQEFPLNIIKWQREEKISTRGASLEWNTLNHDLNILKQTLLKLTDSDPKTKEFRYLADLMEAKELYEQLRTLLGSLTQYEPNIVLGAPGPNQVDKASKHAIYKVIDVLTQAIYVEKITESIDKIIEKYEPIAKKIQESEERKAQQAFEASKQPKRTGAVTVAGKSDRSTKTSEKSSPFGRGGATGGFTPSIGQAGEAPRLGREEKAGQSTGSGVAGETGKPSEKEEKEQGPKEIKKDDAALNKALDALREALIKIEDLIDDSRNNRIKNLATYVLKNKHITDTIDHGLIKELIKLFDEIKSAFKKRSAVEKLIAKVKAGRLYDVYLKDFNETMRENSANLEILQKQLTTIMSQWGVLESELSPDMAYGFFGREDVSEKIKSVTKSINLAELLDAVNALLSGQKTTRTMEEKPSIKERTTKEIAQPATTQESLNLLEKALQSMQEIVKNNNKIKDFKNYFDARASLPDIDNALIKDLILVEEMLSTVNDLSNFIEEAAQRITLEKDRIRLKEKLSTALRKYEDAFNILDTQIQPIVTKWETIKKTKDVSPDFEYAFFNTIHLKDKASAKTQALAKTADLKAIGKILKSLEKKAA